ncbi:hypothetical protein HBI56_211260 [Parastagonospora nodorum]|nr:hypothetical protein HBH51_187130 [Parastagonospora nodorum]KAH3992781.1 hypothetical protein HBI10_212770 [Parastagonospora nodorum]KAH4029755.1 hypothetical protein HBI13_032080 [Parastagonospora nodorum]KAH4115270.1 hypothetical protein HBH47_184980 [Parastagonospora nodorum]KAH4191615.1 hypothetical protein HBI95_212270 [Parastagonospora nodorum]
MAGSAAVSGRREWWARLASGKARPLKPTIGRHYPCSPLRHARKERANGSCLLEPRPPIALPNPISALLHSPINQFASCFTKLAIANPKSRVLQHCTLVATDVKRLRVPLYTTAALPHSVQPAQPPVLPGISHAPVRQDLRCCCQIIDASQPHHHKSRDPTWLRPSIEGEHTAA